MSTYRDMINDAVRRMDLALIKKYQDFAAELPAGHVLCVHGVRTSPAGWPPEETLYTESVGHVITPGGKCDHRGPVIECYPPSDGHPALAVQWPMGQRGPVAGATEADRAILADAVEGLMVTYARKLEETLVGERTSPGSAFGALRRDAYAGLVTTPTTGSAFLAPAKPFDVEALRELYRRVTTHDQVFGAGPE